MDALRESIKGAILANRARSLGTASLGTSGSARGGGLTFRSVDVEDRATAFDLHRLETGEKSCFQEVHAARVDRGDRHSDAISRGLLDDGIEVEITRELEGLTHDVRRIAQLEVVFVRFGGLGRF